MVIVKNFIFVIVVLKDVEVVIMKIMLLILVKIFDVNIDRYLIL